MPNFRLLNLNGKYSNGRFALVSEEDYDRLSKYSWRVNNHGYVVRTKKIDEQPNPVSLHRDVLLPPPGVDVDHYNGDKLDNRRENLRFCNPSQNGANSKLRSDNTSGFRGVIKSGSKFIAQIRVKQKRIYLGTFRTSIEAASAYNNAAIKHFGLFASVNIFTALVLFPLVFVLLTPLAFASPGIQGGDFSSQNLPTIPLNSISPKVKNPPSLVKPDLEAPPTPEVITPTIKAEIVSAEYIAPKPVIVRVIATGGNQFPFGQCTWGVANIRPVPWGGNAYQWAANAQAMGYAIGSNPRVGAIMVTWESSLGHVAYVTAVYANGSYQIKEMNNSALGGWGIYNYRTIYPGDVPLISFIY